MGGFLRGDGWFHSSKIADVLNSSATEPTSLQEFFKHRQTPLSLIQRCIFFRQNDLLVVCFQCDAVISLRILFKEDVFRTGPGI
jgi:hypothetical protein